LSKAILSSTVKYISYTSNYYIGIELVITWLLALINILLNNIGKIPLCNPAQQNYN
jgi:hypothetical protein